MRSTTLKDTLRAGAEQTPETEAHGQTDRTRIPVPGSREYRKHVLRLINGKMTYEAFIEALGHRERQRRPGWVRGVFRTLLEGIAGRSFPSRTPPR